MGSVTAAITASPVRRATFSASEIRPSSRARATVSSFCTTCGPKDDMVRLGDAAAAGDRDLAGPDQLDQAEGADHVLEGLDLVVGAGDLHRHAALRDVHGLAAEDLGELHHLGAGLAVLARDLEQRQLAGHRLDRLEVADLDHVYELV